MNGKRKLSFKRFNVTLNFIAQNDYLDLFSQKLVDERDMKWKGLVLGEIEKNVDEMQR